MDNRSVAGIWSILGRVLGEFIRNKRVVTVLLVLSLFAAAFDVSIPIINQKLIDALVNSLVSGEEFTSWHLAIIAASILVATLIGRSLTNAYGYRLFQEVTKIEDRFRDRAYAKYLNLDTYYHHSNSSGQIIGRIDRGAVGLYAILHDIVGQSLVVPAIYFVVILTILVFKDPFIALLVVLPLPTYLFLVRSWSRQVYEIDRRAHDQFELAGREQYDVASNVMTVKRFTQENREALSQQDMRSAAREIQYGAEKLWNRMDMLQATLAAAGRVVVLFFAGSLVMRGEITIGELTLFLSLQSMVYAPMFQLSVLFPRLRRNIARAERLFQVIDEPIEILDSPGAQELSPLSHEVIFQNVWFRYHNESPLVLKGIDLKIEKGKVVALVGRSGSGKSTAVNLLVRAYEPTSGAILIDGHDIKGVTQKSLRRQIATVSQEVELLGRSVKENIRYGRPDATDLEVEEAARVALAHEFIEKLEEGYDTIVGERGLKLSGGQRQRVSIARAILRNPMVLILDEALSQLDTLSERLVQEATDRVMAGRTVIIIAHRLSTVMRADQIVVFDHGDIEAVGKHEELLSKSLIYKRLYELQFAS